MPWALGLLCPEPSATSSKCSHPSAISPASRPATGLPSSSSLHQSRQRRHTVDSQSSLQLKTSPSAINIDCLFILWAASNEIPEARLKNLTAEDRATTTSSNITILEKELMAQTNEVDDLQKTVWRLTNENTELKNKLAKANEKCDDVIRHKVFGPRKPSVQVAPINKQQQKFSVEIRLLTNTEPLFVGLIYCGF